MLILITAGSMNDNDLIRLFRPIIVDQLASRNYVGVVVKQNNQPTQQGVNTGPTVYFSKIGDKRYGSPGKHDVWDSDLETMVHTEVEQYETSFQISTMVRSLPTTPNQYTASDLCNEVSAIMQSDYAISTLMESNVGLLRVMDIRNIWYLDDRDQFQESPSFDFVLTHLQTRVSTDPVVELINLNIKRV